MGGCVLLGRSCASRADVARMHRKTAQVLAGVNLFVQGDRSAITDHGGAQPMPLHVRCQAGPIHYDQELRQARQPLLRKRGIEVETMRFEVGVAKQSIDAFDAMAHADCAGGANSQGNEAKRMSVD